MSHRSRPRNDRLIRAVLGEPVDRTPVWMMRQAGRYLEEYRALRERWGFMDLIRSPELAAEVSLQPYRAFGMDGVILFSDILVTLPALGVDFDIGDAGPHIPRPLKTARDIAALREPGDPEAHCAYVYRILDILQREVGAEVTLIGFGGAPVTLAAYMIEGGGAKDRRAIKTMMYREPELLHGLLDRLARLQLAFLLAQAKHGARVVQLFDTWAGELAPEDFRDFALPHARKILSGLRQAGVPSIYYLRGAAGLLEHLRTLGADCLSLDGGVDLAQARAVLGPDQPVQGNLDPCVLLGPEARVRQRTREILKAGGGRGHVLNLGHGILPETPRENARAFVETGLMASAP